eukprot:m.304946 g.304946  ORF g.304946 m.304946 type:complete len:128 (-) comp27335_c1_seq10:846-1229(-)
MSPTSLTSPRLLGPFLSRLRAIRLHHTPATALLSFLTDPALPSNLPCAAHIVSHKHMQHALRCLRGSCSNKRATSAMISHPGLAMPTDSACACVDSLWKEEKIVLCVESNFDSIVRRFKLNLIASGF